uniref:Uncharacterized protein n=1 Tax=Anopheles maculatus TaxID=74869 RepID=A0A182SJH7_9DIPT
MKRHYYVQKMNSQEKLGADESAGADTAGIYTITVPRVEVAFPGVSDPVGKSAPSPTFTAILQRPPQSIVDFGTVNIYQDSGREVKGAARSDALPGGKIVDPAFDDKSDNSSNLSVTTTNDEDSDIISEYIGHYGRWQFGWTFLLCLFQIPTTFHIFCLVFQPPLYAGSLDRTSSRAERARASQDDYWSSDYLQIATWLVRLFFLLSTGNMIRPRTVAALHWTGFTEANQLSWDHTRV